MFALVPILRIGILTNRVTALVISGSRTLTSIASVSSPPWSKLSSVSNENLWLWHNWTTLSWRSWWSSFSLLLTFPQYHYEGTTDWPVSWNDQPKKMVDYTHWWTGPSSSKLRRRISSVAVSSCKVLWLADFEWRTTSYLPPNDTYMLQTSVPCHRRI